MQSGAAERWRDGGRTGTGTGTDVDRTTRSRGPSGGGSRRTGGGDQYARGQQRKGTLWTSADSSPDARRPKSAADVDRDARAASESLKRALSTHPPWAKDVEASRQLARNAYLTLLFAHPLSTYAQSLDALWLNTSYSLISAYRSAVSRAEEHLPAHQSNRKNPMGDPEFRKVITRFRQALASEETFYRTLVGRLVAFYQLHDLVRPYLAPLGFALSDGPGGQGGLAAGETSGEQAGLAPTSKDEARDKLALVYKALVCLGDIERYKDQYSDRARRGPGAAGKARGEEMYARAKDYYEIARSLLPDDGAAFNQLAVISTYGGDDLQTTYYYFRALAVRSAFKNGDDILGKFLKKLSDRYGVQQEGDGADEVDAWKREFLLCVSAVYRVSGLSQLGKISAKANERLDELLSERKLPSEIIVKLTVIATGAHWHIRASSSLTATTNGSVEEFASRRRAGEEAALQFVLSTIGTLLDVAAREVESVNTESAVADDDESLELHSHITAVLRRILPSLRIASKWLKLHLDYMSRFAGSSAVGSGIAAFWSRYHRFISAISHIFPLLKLPELAHPLEEDRDMRGFIPLSRGLAGRGDAAGDLTAGAGETDEVHPNEEQLMRLADLQVDATLILQAQTTAAGLASLPAGAGFAQHRDEDLASVSTETEEDPVNMAMRATLTDGSSTDAEEEHRHEDDDDDDEEEEIIVWGKNAQTPRQGSFTQPQQQANRQPLPSAQTAQELMHGMLQPAPGPASPGRSAAQGRPAYSSPKSNHVQTRSNRNSMSTPVVDQPSGGLLFGGDTGGIWRMTREESEKGQRRSSAAAAAAEAQKKQEAIKAIWADPPTSSQAPSVPPPSAAAPPMPNPAASQAFPSPGLPPGSGGGWGATGAAPNDAASLLAGLTSGAGWASGAAGPFGAPPVHTAGNGNRSPSWQGHGQPQGYAPSYAAGFAPYGQQTYPHNNGQSNAQHQYGQYGGYHPG